MMTKAWSTLGEAKKRFEHLLLNKKKDTFAVTPITAGEPGSYKLDHGVLFLQGPLR